jgi:hypothetical protein
MQIYDDLLHLGYYQSYNLGELRKIAETDEFWQTFIPFIEEVKRVGKLDLMIAETQELDGLALICLEGRTPTLIRNKITGELQTGLEAGQQYEQGIIALGLIPL